MKTIFIQLLIAITFLQCTGQKQLISEKKTTQKPKLVIGLVVDQMRYDYLIRFYDKYSDNGFKRLMNSGFNCENTHLNYVPTHTAVGHSSIFTGTTPSIHGIIANNFYDKNLKKMVYCVDDDNYETVGTKKGGKKSPSRLKVTTIADQLHLAQHNKGKTIGISIKDRASILPIGHTANAAYWFRGKKDGKFISSTFYMNELPNWVNNFNKKDLARTYLNQTWNTLYPINTYTESFEDDNNFEESLKGEDDVTFPHDLPEIFAKKENYSLIKATPFGNSLLLDFTKATILGENLGKGNYTDFLTVSFSSTDYIGHTFGVESKEVQDTYLRLDKELGEFLTFLDVKIGKDNYTLFLTADHGALSAYGYLESLKIPTRYFDNKGFKKFLKKLTLKHFNSEKIIANSSNFQLFFDKDELNKLNLTTNQVAEKLKEDVLNFDGVYKSITAKTLQSNNFSEGLMHYTQNGYNQKLSGDLILIPEPNTVFYHEKGSEHSTGFNYDTHIPLLFYGNGIKKGKNKRHINVTDIAPTISSLLKIENPNGNSGKIIEEVLE